MQKLLFAILLFSFNLPTWALGIIDGATSSRVVGWACQPGSNETVGIHIYVNGTYVGGGNAPLLREFAVAQACGTTNSDHGFDIAFAVPPTMLDGTTKDVMVYSLHADGTAAVLNNAPVKVKFDALPGRARPQNLGDIVGRDLEYTGIFSPVNYFGHIGIWDGANVIEAIGAVSAQDTLRITPWEQFSANPSLWPTITPVTKDFAQNYCYDTMCALNGATAFNPWFYRERMKVGPEREIAARRAYVSYLIGASYTRLATFTETRQGTGRYATETCNPFNQASCNPPLVEVKASRGEYRCETFVAHSWAASAIGTGYGTPQQSLYHAYQTEKATQWDNQMRYIISPVRMRTPRTIADAFAVWN